MTPTPCFHCGESVPPDCALTVTIDGDNKQVCCHGCQAVARMIAGADMTAFYQQRTGYSAQPETIDPSVVHWYQDTDWLATFAQNTPEGLKIPLLVNGMTCAACTWVIDKFLSAKPEIQHVDVNLTLGRVVITLSPGALPADAIEQLLRLGYTVRPWRTDERLDTMRAENRRDIRRLGVAGLSMMQVGMFAIALHAGDLQGMDTEMQQLLRGFSAPLTIMALVYSGRTFFVNAWRHLRQRALIMDSSVALALLIATFASLWATVRGGGETYYDSVTMFIFFLLLARYIEKRLRDADLIALVKLEDDLPEFVNVWRVNQWQRSPRDHIEPGDRLRVSEGEAIAFDGEVVLGSSAVEESVFTGESVPRRVSEGDPVYAGTVNADASFEMRAHTRYQESRLAALADDVERARRDKPTYLKLIDRIAAQFVALVLVAATITAISWWLIDPERALWSALAVLVIACPCALSLATPAAMASATAWLRQNGVMVRGEFGLLAAADANTLLIDKTGTLTYTDLNVDAIVCAETLTEGDVLALAAGLQAFSQHPAARAFHNLRPSSYISDVEVVAGRGMTGRLLGEDCVGPSPWGNRLRLGSDTFCREWLPQMPQAPDADHYWIGLVSNTHWLAWIGLGERLKPKAIATVSDLKALGLQLRIVSGDSEVRVAQLATTLGIDCAAALTPSDKLNLLQAFQQSGSTVIAVGDGLNDAPLLGAADASIAVAGATALAQAQADFVVMDDDISKLPTIIRKARQAKHIMRQNLAWAASYNILGIPFAALGFVPPWLAALGMSLSSLCVVLNALRLRRITHGRRG